MAEAEARVTLIDDLPGSEDALTPGTQLLGGIYTIDRFLKSGGFGITYIAHNSLGRYVVIKECFPGAICARKNQSVVVRSRHSLGELAKVVNCFKLEVRALSRIDHKNIVKVHDVFDENDTAYMAMDLISGPDLLDLIDDRSAILSPDNVMSMLRQLLGALSYVHGLGMLHRDISPDNILLNDDGDPVLIDFGAAREESVRKSRALSGLQIVKDGYSPQELYIKGSDPAPTIDIYALGATFYHVISGEVPPDGNSRLLKIAEGQADPYKSLVGRAEGYPEEFLRSIDKALRVLPRDRFQTMDEWTAYIDGKISSEGAEAAIASMMDWLDQNPSDMAEKPTRETSREGIKAAPDPALETSDEPEETGKVRRLSFGRKKQKSEDKTQKAEERSQSASLRLLAARATREKLAARAVEDADDVDETKSQPKPAAYRIRRAAIWVIGLSIALGAVIWPY